MSDFRQHLLDHGVGGPRRFTGGANGWDVGEGCLKVGPKLLERRSYDSIADGLVSRAGIDGPNHVEGAVLVRRFGLELHQRTFELGILDVKEVGNHTGFVHGLGDGPRLEEQPRCTLMFRRDTDEAELGVGESPGSSRCFSRREGRSDVFHRKYDVTPDDQRFVMLRSLGGVKVGELIVVENFFEELKAKVGN